MTIPTVETLSLSRKDIPSISRSVPGAGQVPFRIFDQTQKTFTKFNILTSAFQLLQSTLAQKIIFVRHINLSKWFMQKFQFLLITYWIESAGFIMEFAPDVRTMPFCANLQNMTLTQVPIHTYGSSRTLRVTALALHTRLFSCVSEGLGQCLLPQTSSLATCDSTLSSLNNGLGTLRSDSACANIFLTRLYRKSLCHFLIPTTVMNYVAVENGQV